MKKDSSFLAKTQPMKSQGFCLIWPSQLLLGFPSGSDCKESTCNDGDMGSIPSVGKITWRREQLPTPVFWPGEFHGQKSLTVYNPWGRKESDMTDRISLTHSEFPFPFYKNGLHRELYLVFYNGLYCKRI